MKMNIRYTVAEWLYDTACRLIKVRREPQWFVGDWDWYTIQLDGKFFVRYEVPATGWDCAKLKARCLISRLSDLIGDDQWREIPF